MKSFTVVALVSILVVVCARTVKPPGGVVDERDDKQRQPATSPTKTTQSATAQPPRGVAEEVDDRPIRPAASVAGAAPTNTTQATTVQPPRRVAEEVDDRPLRPAASAAAASPNATQATTVQPPRRVAEEVDDQPRRPVASTAATSTTQAAIVQSTTCVDRFIRVDNATHSCDLLLTTSRLAFDLNKEFWCNQYSRTECCATCARLRQDGQIS